MKKIIRNILLVLVVLIVAAVAVLFLSLNSLVKKGFETVGPKLTKVEMRLDKASLSPLSGSGKLTGIFIGNPEGCKTPFAIKAEEIALNVSLASVRTDTVVVNEITVRAPEVTIEGGMKENNLTQILANIEAATGGGGEAGPADKEQPAEGKKFQVRELNVTGGKVHVKTALTLGKEVTVPLPDIRLKDIGSGGGVSAAELSKKIMDEILSGSTRVANEAIAGLGKNVQEAGKEAAGQAEKAVKGVKNLFKK